MKDKIDRLRCGSIIQHGKYNDRIYCLKASEKEIYSLPSRLIEIAVSKGYGKIFVKINEIQALPFLSEGYLVEARVPGMYPRQREALFLAYYLKKDRKIEKDRTLIVNNMNLAQSKQRSKTNRMNPSDFKIRACNKLDIPVMIRIYKRVFSSYPFPIHDADYIQKTMDSHVDYFCVESNKEIVALASAEKDEDGSYAEMTDFATLPEWRGNSLANHLLYRMEMSVKTQGVMMAFSIARAVSAGMNITFAKAGYHYGGRLKNNTNIAGQIESMNIWYKKL